MGMSTKAWGVLKSGDPLLKRIGAPVPDTSAGAILKTSSAPIELAFFLLRVSS